MPDLEEVPRLRKALGLTQTALARLSNVSQSTIVKIEKRQMNPSYDVVRRVMASLQAELKRQEKKALVEQIQTRKVQYVEAKIPLATAVDEMRHWKFSQMPVMHNGHPVGSISDKVINNLILSGKDPKDLARIRVDEVMEPAFPQVDAKAPVELAASLLRQRPEGPRADPRGRGHGAGVPAGRREGAGRARREPAATLQCRPRDREGRRHRHRHEVGLDETPMNGSARPLSSGWRSRARAELHNGSAAPVSL